MSSYAEDPEDDDYDPHPTPPDNDAVPVDEDTWGQPSVYLY